MYTADRCLFLYISTINVLWGCLLETSSFSKFSLHEHTCHLADCRLQTAAKSDVLGLNSQISDWSENFKSVFRSSWLKPGWYCCWDTEKSEMWIHGAIMTTLELFVFQVISLNDTIDTTSLSSTAPLRWYVSGILQ